MTCSSHIVSLPVRTITAGLLVALLAGCGTLLPKRVPQPAFYALQGNPPTTGVRARATSAMPAPTLLISPPHAAPGFDSRRIIYVREPHRLEYFAHHEWVDTPARMLAPLIVAEVQRGSAFHAVVLTPSPAAGDLRLDTEVVRLQQSYVGEPSQVNFTVRAYVVDNATRKVLASREFNETVAAASDDPYGGVVAANLAVQRVLEQLARFCAEAAGSLKR